MKTTIKLGIVGACGRGLAFRKACETLGRLEIRAVCDLNEASLVETCATLGAGKSYLSYEEMLDKGGIDAVLIATPMHFHAPMAVQALQRDIHVLSEVTAGVSIQECRDLVLACRTSKAVYMLAENYTYMKPNVLVREMTRQGVFGTPYYAEGEYLHELKEMNEVQTPWRRKWQTGVDGITYGTHSLGPILQWFAGDRIQRVCCEGVGVRHTDRHGVPYCQSSSTMLAKTTGDALIKIRVDMVSDRPHAMTNYQLQGTDGAYESARSENEQPKIWLRSRCEDSMNWRHLIELEEEFLPEDWKTYREVAESTGHGGGDFFEVLDFVNAIDGEKACPIGIDEAMDMTLPGLVSQKSAAERGAWMDVPDSRDWR